MTASTSQMAASSESTNLLCHVSLEFSKVRENNRNTESLGLELWVILTFLIFVIMDYNRAAEDPIEPLAS
jgi:hypothetical protein